MQFAYWLDARREDQLEVPGLCLTEYRRGGVRRAREDARARERAHRATTGVDAHRAAALLVALLVHRLCISYREP